MNADIVCVTFLLHKVIKLGPSIHWLLQNNCQLYVVLSSRKETNCEPLVPLFVIPKTIVSCQLFCISFLILNFKSRHDPLSHESIAEEDDMLLTFRFVGFCVKPTFNIKKYIMLI